MKINYSFHDVDAQGKKELEIYVNQEKLQKLTRVLQHGNLEIAELDIRTEYQSHHNSYVMKMELKIPRHILVAEETAYDITAAFDSVIEKIVAQMRKIESIRHHK
jgi:ribosomal subunit interface protein